MIRGIALPLLPFARNEELAMNNTVTLNCCCGQQYTVPHDSHEWPDDTLPHVTHEIGDTSVTIYRCTCGSPVAVDVADDEHGTHTFTVNHCPML